jgi:hypothetical protein
MPIVQSIEDLPYPDEEPEPTEEPAEEATDDESDDVSSEGGDEPEEDSTEGAGEATGDGDEGDEGDKGKPSKPGAQDDDSGKPESDADREPPRFKVKIDGEEQEVDSEELVKGYQTAQASNKRFQEAAQLREDAKFVLESIQQDPFGVLTQLYTNQLGGNREQAREAVFKVAESYVGSMLEELMAPAEKRAAIRAEREAQYYRSEAERLRREQEERDAKTQAEQHAGEVMGAIRRAITEAELPEDPQIVSQVAEAMLAAEQNDIEISAADAVQMVRKKVTETVTSKLPSLSYDDFRKQFPDFLEKMRQEDLAKAKEQQRSTRSGKASPPGSSTKPKRRSKAKQKPSDFFTGEFADYK